MANNEIQPGTNPDQHIQVTSQVVGHMRDLGGTFTGGITYSLSSDGKYEAFTKIADEALVGTVSGGQRACMDGRGSNEALLPGPKTAGGTQGDARRVNLALHAAGVHESFEESLNTVMSIDEENGFTSGGHEPGQCGAVVHANTALQTIADRPEETGAMVQTLFSAIGQPALYSQESMDAVVAAAKTIAQDEIDASALTDKNPAANPVLQGEHNEQEIIIIARPGITLDNNKLINNTGSEQAFAYNLDYHVTIAQYLTNKYGENTASLYLHSAAAMDVHTLTKLTDGSLKVRVVS